MSEPTLQDCINYMRSQIKQMEKHPRNYEFNLPYYRKTVELLEKSDRQHGEWIYDVFDENYHCSECNRVGATIYPFCPYCGSDNRPEEGDRDE